MPDDQELFFLDLTQMRKMPQIIKSIEDKGSNVKPPLKRWAVYHIGQTSKMFDKGGREKIKWKPLAKVTKIMRAYRKRGKKRTGPVKILRDTGLLAQQSGRSELLIRGGSSAIRRWNPTPYADVHEFGGYIDIPERIITPKKKGGVLAFVPHKGRSGGGQVVFAKRVVQPAKRKKVPKRPHMIITEKDEQKAAELLEKHEGDVLGAK